MFELVATYEDVVKNIEQFNKDLQAGRDVITQLNTFHHWYYIPDLDAFGPSKYIGYQDMTADRYQRGKDKDGRVTEVALQRWFIELSETDPRWTKLAPRLEVLLQRWGKEPRIRFRIHVPK